MRAGLCDEAQQARCAEEYGAFLEGVCEKCESRLQENLHPYTLKMLRVHALREAGYPLAADDLSVEEWEDLAELTRMMKEPRSPLI